jgi:hypothetical protein
VWVGALRSILLVKIRLMGNVQRRITTSSNGEWGLDLENHRIFGDELTGLELDPC